MPQGDPESLEFRRQFSEGLRRFAAERGVTKSELAQRLGVTRQRLANYITGETTPSGEVLLRAMTALGIEFHSKGHVIGLRPAGTTLLRDGEQLQLWTAEDLC